MAVEPKEPTLHRFAEEIGDVEALDRPAEAVATQVRKVIPHGPVKDALSGTWLGHALHPLLTDIPIGTWWSATLLDVIGGRMARPAARRLIATGIAAAVPTAITGSNDWADTTRGSATVRRVGAVHAIANVGALAMYSASYLARRRGRHGAGFAFGLGGIGALVVSGYLGGHLTYARGVGVDQTVFDDAPDEWADAIALDELRDGEPKTAMVGEVRVMLVRQGSEVRALDDHCCHRGGALHEGEIHDGSVTCPLHGSTFELRDGSVVRGPAAYPQRVFDVRVTNERVQLRARSEA
jgi:nitrite reductase/ring-hydroxylating ferredoxin subunit/uncharacterized membrane protein